MNHNDTAKTGLVAALLFYNPCCVLRDQFVLVMVTQGPVTPNLFENLVLLAGMSAFYWVWVRK